MLLKDNKAIDSPPTDEESNNFVGEQNDQVQMNQYQANQQFH